jgi:hypothetical protein
LIRPKGEKCRREEMTMFSATDRPWTMPSALRSSGHSTSPAMTESLGCRIATGAPSTLTSPRRGASAP